MLSDDRIRALMLAHGFTVKDGLTDLKPYVYAASRAIESAACAERDARIAELEAENFKVSAALNYRKDKCAVLTRELEEARKDAELLDWMIFYSARVGHDSDGEFCQCIWINEDGEQRTKLFGNAREAIRAAIKEQT